ncbi:MAG: CsbD family protein [Bacillota bacterium]
MKGVFDMNEEFENKAEDLKGRVKEAGGAVTGDDSLKAEGERDQKKADLKDKVEAAEGKVDDLKDKVEEKIDDVF